MIRILYVHHRSELGGSPASLSYLIEQLDRTRYEPHVYCPAGPAAELFRRAGAVVHTGPVASFTHIWASTYSGRRWLLLVREIILLPLHLVRFRSILRRGFDLVHLNDSPLIPAAWAARRARIPVVWHLRSALPGGGRDRRSRFVRGAVRRFAAASIGITRNVAETFGADVAVVPNAVDLERYRPGERTEARATTGLPAGRPVVSFFGFVYPSKGFRDYIEAAALLRALGVDALFLVVGGDVRGERFFRTPLGRTLRVLGLARNYDETAKALVARLGLRENVLFVPFTQETPAYYRASDVVVAPSRGPELGRPVLEASASGRPVVASGSLDGAGIIVPEETGYLVPQRSPDVLAAALALLLDDDELRERVGERARAHAERQFSPAAAADSVRAIYDTVLAGR